jgi:hypothetical protein
MTSLKGWITTTFLATALTLSATPISAGVIITDLTQQPCTVNSTKESKTDFGVLIYGLTGVIITGFTGVIIIGATDVPTENCGVIIIG